MFIDSRNYKKIDLSPAPARLPPTINDGSA